MTVASDTSVASIYRPTSGPRTQADTDKKEGAGSFGMMLDQTKQTDVPTQRADRGAARSDRRGDTRPAADRRPDAPRTKESRHAKDTKAADQADRSRDSKRSDDVKETNDTTDTQTAGQAGESKEQQKTQSKAQSKAQDAQASEQAPQDAQTGQAGQAVETTMDAAVVQDGAAVATEATGETVVAAEMPAEDPASENSEKTDDAGTAPVVVTIAADTTPIPIAAVAVAADPTAPVSTEATAEGDAEAVAAAKAANTQGAAAPTTETETPNEAAAPVVAEPAAKTEGTPEAALEAKPEATSEAAPETKAEAKAQASSEAKSEAESEAKQEAKADAKIEGATPKLATTETKPASGDKPDPAIKSSTDEGAPKPDVKDAQHTKHASEVNREIADGVSTKASDATLAAAKAGLESVQSLNAATAAQPAPPALHLNVTATAAAAGAAIANNMASNAVPIDGVAVEIAAQAQNGKTSFDIRLDPKELGRIDVRLEVDKDGHVTAKMTVDRVETLDLLKRDASNIERALQQAGLKTSDNSLEFSMRDQTFSNNNRNDDTRGNANAAQLVIPDNDGASLETVRSNYGRLLGLGRGIDIRI